MAEDERKSRLHIHLGGVIILIIIALILFKVDLKSKIESPQFQKNYTYITEQAKIFWQNYILNPLKAKTGTLFIDLTNKGLKQMQDNFSNNVLKTPSLEDLER
ncbi:MAG: hypothetical protein WC603_03220 [Candidatus Paceibacterota bacterium]|jgi:hypothetical protein